MVLKLSKKVHFLQFCADLSKKSKSIKAIYIYESERSHYAFWQNVIVYYVMTYCFGNIRVWSRWILLNFCWVSIFFDISIANISWTVVQTPINHTLFWKCLIRPFRCIYVNCCNRFSCCWISCWSVSTKFQKMHFFGQFKDHNSGKKDGN